MRHDTAFALNEVGLTLADLRKGMGGVEQMDTPHAIAQPDNAPDQSTAELRKWVFLTGPTRFRHIDTGEEMPLRSFDMKFRSLVPMMDFLPNGTVVNKPREVSPSEWLVGYGFGRSVSDTIYLPQQSDGDPVVEIDGVEYLNSYLPAHVPAAASVFKGHPAVNAWEQHLCNILPDDWRTLLAWLAHNVQHPGKKILWAPIIKGTQGDGKTSIGKMLGVVMGRGNVKIVSPETLFSDFTSYAEGSCVAFLEEIRVKGHNRHDAMNKLKPLITNDTIEVVRKGHDGCNVPNVTNYMAFTNFDDALVLDENDRRWGVFFTPFESRAALIEAGMGDEYFDRLHGFIEGFAGVLRAWLLSIDLSAFNPKSAPPMTTAKRTMIASSISQEAATVLEMIKLGREGVGRHVVATSCVNAALKQEFNAPIQTSRMATVFNELGWHVLPFEVKWRGQARKVYVSTEVDWPKSEPHLRAMVRDHLDATLNQDQVDRAAGREFASGGW